MWPSEDTSPLRGLWDTARLALACPGRCLPSRCPADALGWAFVGWGSGFPPGFVLDPQGK